MLFKIVSLIFCALLLFVSYRANFVAQKVLKKQNPSESMILKIKIGALTVSMVLFVIVMIFDK